MKKFLLITLSSFCIYLFTGAPASADSEVFTVKGKDVDYTGVYPAHIKTVAVITPASYPAPKNFNKGIKLLRDAGLKVKVYPHVTMVPKDLAKNYLASIPVELRVKDFEAAWCDMENDIIICARGGFGTQDLVANINWKKLPRRPELYVLGYSDVTMLLCALSAKGYGHPLAGPSINSHPGLSKEIIPLMKNMLHGEEVKVKLTPLRSGDCSGEVVAGLLIRYTQVMKANYGLQTAGRIVIVESVGANSQKITDYLDELLAAGFFKDVAAIVFGHITNTKDTTENIDAALKKFTEKVDVPVYTGFPFGHHTKHLVIDFFRSAEIKNNTIIFPACNAGSRTKKTDAEK